MVIYTGNSLAARHDSLVVIVTNTVFQSAFMFETFSCVLCSVRDKTDAVPRESIDANFELFKKHAVPPTIEERKCHTSGVHSGLGTFERAVPTKGRRAKAGDAVVERRRPSGCFASRASGTFMRV